MEFYGTQCERVQIVNSKGANFQFRATTLIATFPNIYMVNMHVEAFIFTNLHSSVDVYIVISSCRSCHHNI